MKNTHRNNNTIINETKLNLCEKHVLMGGKVFSSVSSYYFSFFLFAAKTTIIQSYKTIWFSLESCTFVVRSFHTQTKWKKRNKTHVHRLISRFSTIQMVGKLVRCGVSFRTITVYRYAYCMLDCSEWDFTLHYYCFIEYFFRFLSLGIFAACYDSESVWLVYFD